MDSLKKLNPVIIPSFSKIAIAKTAIITVKAITAITTYRIPEGESTFALGTGVGIYEGVGVDELVEEMEVYGEGVGFGFGVDLVVSGGMNFGTKDGDWSYWSKNWLSASFS